MEEMKISIGTRLKSFTVQCGRVWHLLKKPTMDEFKAISKISALGILVMGLIGFIISDILTLVLK